MKSPTIRFKAKAETVLVSGVNEVWIRIPELKRSHCDMDAFRNHQKYGSYANSNMFEGILGRIKREIFGSAEYVKMHTVPNGVTVDSREFLATVTITLR